MMESELTPVRCGCGGEAIVGSWWRYSVCRRVYAVSCAKCGIQIKPCDTEAEAVEAWNRAMGERTAKVKKSPAIQFSEDENMGYIVNSGICECTTLVFNDVRYKYCPQCGARLEWDK